MALALARDGVGRELGVLDRGTLRNVVLTRIVSAGAHGVTRATVRQDLAPLVANRLSPAEWRGEHDLLLVDLFGEGLVLQVKARLCASEKGVALAAGFLGGKDVSGLDWTEVRDVVLVARALGLEALKPPKKKRLSSAIGLRSAIVERAFGIVAKGKAGPAAIRKALARKALSGSAGAKARSADAAREAAAGLLRRPRKIANDNELLALLAAEQVGSPQTAAPALRTSLLRRLIAKAADAPKSAPRPASAPAVLASGKFAPVVAVADRGGDLAAFAAEVNRVARQIGDGWLGSRRAFIARVHEKMQESCRLAGSIEEFKTRLVEAHREGRVTLVYADLRDRASLADVQRSAVRYKNMEWHFVRVED